MSTETAQFYGYVKDWPAERWRELFAALGADASCLLVGHAREPRFDAANIVDLRGRDHAHRDACRSSGTAAGCSSRPMAAC